MENIALERQAQKIDEFRKLSKPYQKHIAGLQLTILPDVFPGGTDSELLCETMIIRNGDLVLDVCTGNGVVALVAAHKGAKHVIGTDLNLAAIENANLNRNQLNLKNVSFVETDLFPTDNSRYDVITANMPYSDHPAPDKTAICFWDEGNKTLKVFFRDLKHHLKPTGKVFLSWPSFGDSKLLTRLAKEHHLHMHLVNSRTSKSSGFEYYVYEITLS